tara:strand:+ start:6568 stop:6924 length:357 start_codon:yes stop_codon:yes gene_type:complete
MEIENDSLKNELAKLKQELEALKPIMLPVVEKKKRGRPKLDTTIPRADYMKNYMKNYNEKNKEQQKMRYNTYYYLKHTDMPKDYVDKYKNYACLVYKTRKEIEKIKQNCPQFLSDVII